MRLNVILPLVLFISIRVEDHIEQTKKLLLLPFPLTEPGKIIVQSTVLCDFNSFSLFQLLPIFKPNHKLHTLLEMEVVLSFTLRHTLAMH